MVKGIERSSYLKQKIPGNFAKQVGHIIIRWAFFEYQLSKLTWDILGLDDKMARIAVASPPRAQDRLDRIRELLFLKKIAIDDKMYSNLKSLVETIGKNRDLLAHCIWVHDEKGWAIISFSGNVSDQTIEKLARNRKLRPERIGMTTENLAQNLEAIDKLIKAVDDLRDWISSPEKLPKRPDAKGPQKKRQNPARP